MPSGTGGLSSDDSGLERRVGRESGQAVRGLRPGEDQDVGMDAPVRSGQSTNLRAVPRRLAFCAEATAMEAGVIQARHGAPLGFLNPTLYALAGGPAFHDITNAGAPRAFVNDGPIADGETLLVTAGQCQEPRD
jgi:hypothetical protein